MGDKEKVLIDEYYIDYKDWKDFVLRDDNINIPCNLDITESIFLGPKDISIIKKLNKENLTSLEFLVEVVNSCFSGNRVNHLIINEVNLYLKPLKIEIEEVNDIKELLAMNTDVNKNIQDIVDKFYNALSVATGHRIFVSISQYINITDDLERIKEDLEKGHFKDGWVYLVNRDINSIKPRGYIINRKYHHK